MSIWLRGFLIVSVLGFALALFIGVLYEVGCDVRRWWRER